MDIEGDIVLQMMAKRYENPCEREDHAFRLGGDEFALCCLI